MGAEQPIKTATGRSKITRLSLARQYGPAQPCGSSFILILHSLFDAQARAFGILLGCGVASAVLRLSVQKHADCGQGNCASAQQDGVAGLHCHVPVRICCASLAARSGVCLAHRLLSMPVAAAA